MTPKTKTLFTKRWVKTEDRLWRSCTLCNKITQYMQQHLRAKHKKTDVGAYSVSLKDQRTGMEVTQTHGTKRK